MKFTLLCLLSIATIPARAAGINCTITLGLAVDADGAPDSYRVDGRGLSNTCDGVFAIVDGIVHTQKNDKPHWQDLCVQHWNEARRAGDYSGVKIVGFLKDVDGRPVVQENGDPLPGEAFVTTTTLTIPGTPDRAQRHYVNASEIPYVVLSPAYAAKNHLQLGDLVAVYRPMTGHIAYGVYGDCCSLGEASVRLHQDLGSNPIVVNVDAIRRAKRGISDRIVLVALTGAHTTPTLESVAWRAEIKTKGDAALQGMGGLEAVRGCAQSTR
jgi:hypothetical protein